MDNPILTWTNAYPNPPYNNIETGRPAPWTNSPVFIPDEMATDQNSPTAAGFFCSPTAIITMSGSRRNDRANFLGLFPLGIAVTATSITLTALLTEE